MSAPAPTAPPRRPAKRWHLALLTGLAAAILAAAWQGFDARDVAPYSDTWDYLQLARQIWTGQGFTSLFSYPVFLPLSDTLPFPLLWRPPLQPVLTAFLFLFTGGPSLLAPILLQSLSYVAAILGVYFLALTFLDSGWALLAGLVVALSPDMIGVAEPGVATIPFTAALTFAVLLAVRGTSRRDAFLSGAALGLLTLLRAEAMLLVPAMIWLLWAGERGDRERRIWIYLLAAFLVTVPWTIRNVIVTGRLFFGASSLVYVDTPLFPAWESSRRIDLIGRSPVLWAFAHLDVVVMKSLRNFYNFARQALLLPLPALAPFVWAAMGRITRVGRESAYCSAVLIGLLSFIVVLSPLQFAPRFLHPFIPLVTVVGLILLARIRERFVHEGRTELSRRAAHWIAAAVLALAALQAVGALTATRRDRARRTGPDPAALDWSAAARAVPADRFGLADYPAFYAWYTGKPFLWIPVDEQFDAVAGTGAARRTVILWRDRSGPDPTGIAATPALVRRLEPEGYAPSASGPLVILTGAP